MRKTVASLALFFGCLHPCVAVEGNRDFARFSTLEAVALPVLAVGTGLAATLNPSETARWQNGILFDDFTRDGLRLHHRKDREALTTVGDFLLYGLIAQPLIVDSVFNLALSEKETDLGLNVGAIAPQSFLLTTALTLVTKAVVSRERPYQRECASDSNYDAQCNAPDSRQSFFSGHASLVFTGAGLICATRENLDLWGGKTSCYVALGGATIAAMTRVLADKHYISDVLVGSVVGLLSGYGLPKLMHFNASSKSATITPVSSNRQLGILVGIPF